VNSEPLNNTDILTQMNDETGTHGAEQICRFSSEQGVCTNYERESITQPKSERATALSAPTSARKRPASPINDMMPDEQEPFLTATGKIPTILRVMRKRARLQEGFTEADAPVDQIHSEMNLFPRTLPPSSGITEAEASVDQIDSETSLFVPATTPLVILVCLPPLMQ